MNIYGMPYPLVKNPLGYMCTQEGINQIKSDLLVLLLTNPGERVMLPAYGTPLRKLIFDPNDATLADKARQMIIQSIKTWEPRIVIEAIEITGVDTSSLSEDDPQEPEDLSHIMSIKIKFFDPYDIKNIASLTLELPMTTASQVGVQQTLRLSRNQEETE